MHITSAHTRTSSILEPTPGTTIFLFQMHSSGLHVVTSVSLFTVVCSSNTYAPPVTGTLTALEHSPHTASISSQTISSLSFLSVLHLLLSVRVRSPAIGAQCPSSPTFLVLSYITNTHFSMSTHCRLSTQHLRFVIIVLCVCVHVLSALPRFGPKHLPRIIIRAAASRAA